ncbi:pirin [Mangrovactinospora gilvigrisea]|uniref:Pirin n=1 Tax=Mangrovactinospora gilvigrisea TaxID=1428644 RepID=A0A1J7C7F4_9ACTN|nr:pirin family protein [Mangrovactinospora gilvigrisea]OIV35578.1 pirin [Mangrovactinospora gilvigrisea]
MPAITVENLLVLPRIAAPAAGPGTDRPVQRVVTAQRHLEGAGFEVRRPFPGIGMYQADPFLLLDHMGPVRHEPHEAKGAPWHPHRGFETVTYMLDGEMVHHDSNGGGGRISDGATQWMTAGSGILHDEVPSEEIVANGGWFHGVQLWVNLPRSLKWTAPRYQEIDGGALRLLTSEDGGALVRVIAGELGGHAGPGSTYTPITYAHASVEPGARLRVPWQPDFTAMAYVLEGAGTAGAERRPVEAGQLAFFGPGGSALTVQAAPEAEQRGRGRTGKLEVLLLGGLPIKEPVARYGPFVMNTRQEIIQAAEDFEAGRMGTVPAVHLGDGGGAA